MLSKKYLSTKIKIVLWFFTIIFFGTIIQKIYDYQDYSPSIIIENSNFATTTPIDLYQNTTAQGSFKATHNHLGIIGVKFDTHQRINDDYLQFRIREKGQQNWLYTSKYKVDQFQNNKYFPFGFPKIENSQDRVYEIEIKSLSGKDHNYLTLSPFSDDFIIKYNFTKKYLQDNKNEIPYFLICKLFSFTKHISLSSWAIIFFSPAILFIFLGTKFGKSFIKYFQNSINDSTPISANKKNLLNFLISIYTLIFITLVIIFFNKQSESSEWLIYIISSISIFFLIALLNFKVKEIPQKIFVYTLIIGYILLTAQIIYFVFFINLLNYNYLFLLFISLVPVIFQRKNRVENLLCTLLIEATIIYSISGYFTLDVNSFSSLNIFLICCATLLISYIYNFIIKNNSKKNIATIFSFIIVFIVSTYSVNKDIEYHHYSFYIGPTYELGQGKSILTDVPSQYGYLSIKFLHSILHPFGISYENFHFLNQLLFSIYFLISFFIIKKITKNNFLAVLFSVIAIFFQTQFSLDSKALAPSTGPLRFGLSIIILFLLLYLPKKISLSISSIISAISLFWSIETAIYVVPAYLFCLITHSFTNNQSFSTNIKILSKYLKIFFTSILIISGLIYIHESNYFTFTPSFGNYFQFAKAYKSGFGSEIIPKFGNYYLIVITLITGLVLLLEKIHKNKPNLVLPLSFIAIHNFAIFSYFVSRSNQNNIVNISLFFLIEICIILKILHKKNVYQYFYTLPISIFCALFFYVSLLNVTTPDRLHFSEQKTTEQLNQYQNLAEKYNLNRNNVLIISKDNDTPIIVKNQITTLLPLNPSLMTALLPGYQSRYLLPNLSKIQIGTTLVYSNDLPGIMEFLEKNLNLKTVATDSSDFFSLYTNQ